MCCCPIVQLAEAMGAHVIAGASSGDRDWVSECGAAAVLDKHADDFYRQVGQAAPHGVDVWWDPSGDDDFEKSVPVSVQSVQCQRRVGVGPSGAHLGGDPDRFNDLLVGGTADLVSRGLFSP